MYDQFISLSQLRGYYARKFHLTRRNFKKDWDQFRIIDTIYYSGLMNITAGKSKLSIRAATGGYLPLDMVG